MARTGRPKAKLDVNADERAELERLARRARTNRHLALRAKIILACSTGASNVDVGARLRVSNVTVGKWRRRFIESRVDGLHDDPRPGAPRKISDEDVERVVVKTLETKPKGRTHWSTRNMSKETGLSGTTIGRIWRAFGLKPHVVRSFKLSNDPLFIEKVRDIGEFQESCRLWCTSVWPRKSFHGRFAVDSLERGVRSGLRQTDWTGCQFRVEPAQRSGWRSLAAS